MFLARRYYTTVLLLPRGFLEDPGVSIAMMGVAAVVGFVGVPSVIITTLVSRASWSMCLLPWDDQVCEVPRAPVSEMGCCTHIYCTYI